MPVRNQKPRLPSLGGSKREGCRSGLTAGDAVAQSAIDLAEQLLVDGPEDQRAQLDGVDDEPRGDEHVAEHQVAQKLGLQQPDEVHDVGEFSK